MRAPISAIARISIVLIEPFEHIVEQLDLLAIEAAGGGQKEIGDAPGGFQGFFRRADIYRSFDFVDD